MPKVSPEKMLSNAINRLRSERTSLMARVSEIDASFGRLGIALKDTAAAEVAVLVGKLGKRRGRPPKAPKAAKAKTGKSGRRGARSKFGVSGDESILAFVTQHGQPNAAEINTHWKKEGRGGVANTPISRLVKAGKLTRVSVEGERGSRYKIA
jgi:hypothetical protein